MMGSVPASILLVEDTESTRLGLRLLLEQSSHTVTEASNVEDALLAAEAHPPDVAVVDLVLPLSPAAEADYEARAGLEVVRQLKLRFPRMGIVILSAHPDQGAPVRDLVQRHRWRGVAYLLKGERATHLEQAIDLVRRGGLHFSPQAGHALVPQGQAILDAMPADERQVVVDAMACLGDLTPRELEVLDLAGASIGLNQIASALQISRNTLDNHLARIYDKLGLNTGAAASMRRDLLLAKIALLHHLEQGRRGVEEL
jgi:DNA-binding NarL/FixJ family response regulator